MRGINKPKVNKGNVSIPRLFPKQKEFLANSKQNNILAGGRRLGKSQLVLTIIAISIKRAVKEQKKIRIGYFVPTYKLGEDIWGKINETFQPIIWKSNEAKRMVVLDTNPKVYVEFWSMDSDKAGRSRDYDEVIIDECSFEPKLENVWLSAISPTLLKTNGRSWFFSSATDQEHFFYKLFERGESEKFPSWYAMQAPSWYNPLIDRGKILQMYEEYANDEKIFRREVCAEFISLKGDGFYNRFDAVKSVKKTIYNPDLGKIHLKWDFNAKSTCIVSQHYDEYDVHAYQDLGMFEDANKFSIVNIEVLHDSFDDVCDYITDTYLSNDSNIIYLTGDSSGNARTSSLVPMYDLIIQRITDRCVSKYGYYPKFKNRIPRSKIMHVTSRMCFNHVMNYLKGNYICDPEKCKLLISDYNRVQCNSLGGIDKAHADRNDYGHAADAERYGFENFETDFLMKKGIHGFRELT